MIYIRDGTHVYLLLMLLACVGEYPMQSVYLLGNNRVWKRRIKELQEIQDFCLPDDGKLVRFQMLTVSGQGKNKTMRLHKSALPILKKLEPGAFDYYMKRFENHHFSGAVTHVTRNHRLAETAAMCMASGLDVLPWKVPDPHNRNVRHQRVDDPCLYLSRDLKDFYEDEMKKTEFTRLAGAIVYPHNVYAVYNTRDEAMLWRGRGEEKAQILLSSIFRRGGLREEVKSAVLFGGDFRAAAKTLHNAFSRRHLKERLDKIYENLYFIPMNESGMKMLEILTQDDWWIRLREALFGRIGTWGGERGIECDANIEGTFHYCHLDGDLCSLIRFRSSLRKRPEAQFVLYCYREQVPYIREFLGDYWGRDNLKIRVIKLDVIHTHFCGAKNKTTTE